MGPGRTGRPQDGAGSRGRRAARLRRNQPEPRRTPRRTWPDGRRTLVDGGLGCWTPAGTGQTSLRTCATAQVVPDPAGKLDPAGRPPDPSRTPGELAGTRRTLPQDFPGLRTDSGRNWRRTLQDLEGRPVLPGLLHAPKRCGQKASGGMPLVNSMAGPRAPGTRDSPSKLALRRSFA